MSDSRSVQSWKTKLSLPADPLLRMSARRAYFRSCARTRNGFRRPLRQLRHTNPLQWAIARIEAGHCLLSSKLRAPHIFESTEEHSQRAFALTCSSF